MSIECYALVTFEVPKMAGETAFERSWRLLQTTIEHEVNVKRETETHLCHLRLVQPLGKGGKVPLPRWEVIEKLLNENECTKEDNWDELRTRNGEPIYIGHMWRLIFYKNDVPRLCTYEKVMIHTDDNSSDLEYHYDSERFVTIDDKRIQLRHIRSLFPECAKMPMAIALDYIRDRM